MYRQNCVLSCLLLIALLSFLCFTLRALFPENLNKKEHSCGFGILVVGCIRKSCKVLSIIYTHQYKTMSVVHQ